MSIQELLKENPNITISVKLGDLKEWHQDILASISQNKISDNTIDELLTSDETAKLLKKDISTLWRYAKRGYLVPIKIGGENRYKKSDIDKIIEGRIG